MLTNGYSRVNISPALRNAAPLARVVELVDSLASGASARKGVRVRLPPRAPPGYPKGCPGFYLSDSAPSRFLSLFP